MRVAIIDLGTNSVRFDVHHIGQGSVLRQLHREKLLVRLGQGVFLSGKLDPRAVRRTLQAFQSFKRTAESLHVDKYIAFGTSALRETTQGENLLRRIRSLTGIEVRVISGEEEAKFIALGILNNETNLKGRFALVDIGGGSTEISICEGKKILHSTSFPLGTARLQQIFLKSSPPPSPKKGETGPIKELRRYIKNVLLNQFEAEDWPKATRIIGSSGTIRAFHKIIRRSHKGKRTFTRGELRKLVRAMSDMDTDELLAVPGIESKRVDMILAGGILLEECAEALGSNKIQTTDYSLRDGILDEELRLHRQHEGSHIAFHLGDLRKKALQIGTGERHIDHVCHLSSTLFDKLRPLHGLDRNWKLYLMAAAILHDTGQSITPSNHGLHSYYIVMNSDFPSMEPWETEFVAQLCLRHAGGKAHAKDLSFAKDRDEKTAFLKLLAILRVADALDRGHHGGFTIRRIRTTKSKVQIYYHSRVAADLELLRVEQKKSLFEEVFGRHLVLSRTS